MLSWRSGYIGDLEDKGYEGREWLLKGVEDEWEGDNELNTRAIRTYCSRYSL